MKERKRENCRFHEAQDRHNGLAGEYIISTCASLVVPLSLPLSRFSFSISLPMCLSVSLQYSYVLNILMCREICKACAGKRVVFVSYRLLVVACLLGWLACWLVDWLASWLASWLAGWLVGNPRYRLSSAMYRYARGAPGLEVPSAGRAPFSSLVGCMPRLPLVLPYPAALPRNTETGSGGLDCPAGEPWCSAACAASLGEPRLASSRFLSLHFASPRLVSSRVLATSAHERLVYRFGFRSNYLQRCSRAAEKHVDRGRSVLCTLK